MKKAYFVILVIFIIAGNLFSESAIKQKLSNIEYFNADFNKTVISPIDTQYFHGTLNISGTKVRFETPEEMILSDGEYVILYNEGEKEASRTRIGVDSPLQLDSLWSYFERNFELTEEQSDSGYSLSGKMKTPDVSIRSFRIEFDSKLDPILVAWVDFSKYIHTIEFSNITSTPAPPDVFKFDKDVKIVDME
ncbi:outer-membrane lipoprotein carrier protein LolA [bacterium]|nr:outer-membrane lipoprotein carrier protein LolA [bacterium]